MSEFRGVGFRRPQSNFAGGRLLNTTLTARQPGVLALCHCRDFNQAKNLVLEALNHCNMHDTFGIQAIDSALPCVAAVASCCAQPQVVRFGIALNSTTTLENSMAENLTEW